MCSGRPALNSSRQDLVLKQVPSPFYLAETLFLALLLVDSETGQVTNV